MAGRESEAAPDFLSLQQKPSRRSVSVPQRSNKRPRPGEGSLGYDEDLHAFAAASPMLLHQGPSGAPPLPKETPWAQVAHARHGHRSRPTAAALLRLHEEVLDFWDMSRETPAEAEEASIVLDAMKDALRDAVGEGPELRVFGSRVYGLALPWADWDVTIVKGSRGKIATLQALASALQRRPDFTEVNPILRARVPIVKCRHAATGIELDVSYGEESGCVSAAAVRAFVDQFPALVPLVVVLKHFLSQRGLNVTFKGGIGSFLLTCMVVHHLQMMRADTMVHVQGVRDVAWAQVALDREREAAGEARHAASDAAAAEAAKPRSRPRSQRVAALPRAQLNLGYLLFTFLEYFGRRFRYEHDAIVLVPEPCTISKYDYELGVPGRPFLLSLLSPGEMVHSLCVGCGCLSRQGCRRKSSSGLWLRACGLARVLPSHRLRCPMLCRFCCSAWAARRCRSGRLGGHRVQLVRDQGGPRGLLRRLPFARRCARPCPPPAAGTWQHAPGEAAGVEREPTCGRDCARLAASRPGRCACCRGPSPEREAARH